jgi:hypothetical protein
MRTNDFTSPVTAHALNESMFKKFGVKINFDKYDRHQLENYRNLLRTKVHQEEVGSNFNALLSNESYQKDKYMLDLLNTKIKEMLGESIAVMERKLSKAESKKKEEIVKAIKRDNPEKRKGKGKSSAYAIATSQAKKVAEGKASAAEMAHHHAVEYMKHHKMGNLEMAQHHRDACEACGGKLTHGGMGECFHTHGSINKGQPYPVQESGSMGGVGIGAGASIGGQVGGGIASTMEGKKAKKDYDGDGKIESEKDEVWGSRAKAAAKAGKPFGKKMEEAKKSKPDFLDLDKDGNKKETMKKAAKDKKKKTNESIIAESIAYFITEDEEGKAKTITAGLDMVNDFTSWMQRIATYQTKSMIELADQIRAHFGDAEAQRFKDEVGGALGGSLEALTHSREAISNSVAVLAGEAPAQEPMGSDGDMSVDPDAQAGMEDPSMDMEEPAGDDFATADAAAGGPETTGRIKRESIERGNRLMKILGA